MKKIALILLLIIFFPVSVSAQSFSDVPSNHRYYVAIESLKNLEIIKGYNDGTFKPEQKVNRAEALKILLNSAKIEINPVVTKTGFSDVPPEAWFSVYVIKARDKGIINGNPDGTFAPERLVNKAEYVKMLIQTFNKDISAHNNKTENIANDTNPNNWFYPYFSYAKTLGIITPNTLNQLLPAQELSRGECAEIIYKMLVIDRGGEPQKMLSIAEANLVNLLVALNNNNISDALSYANNAVFYTGKALELKPEEGVVKAADKISQGFLNLTLAYQAGIEQNSEKLKNYVTQAKELAGDAYADDPSSQPLGKKIKTLGNILLEQLN